MSLRSMAGPQAAGLNRLDRKQTELLCRLFERRRFPKNAVVLRRGEHSDVLFVIRRGSIQLATASNRGYSIVINLREGDFFGEEVLIGGGLSPYQATALVDCELHLLDRSDLDEITAQAPGILVKFLRSIAERLRVNCRLCRDRSRRELVGNPLSDRASIESWTTRFLVSMMGTRATIAFFLIAVIAWGFFGHRGIRWLHLGAFDPSPFNALTLFLKLVAAFSTPFFLLTLLHIARQDVVESQSRVNFFQQFEGVEDGLRRPEKSAGDEPPDVTAIRDHKDVGQP